jgi:hypothetical protein
MRTNRRNAADLLDAACETHLESKGDDLGEDAASFLRVQGESVEVSLVTRSDEADLGFVPGFTEGEEGKSERIVGIDLVVRADFHR